MKKLQIIFPAVLIALISIVPFSTHATVINSTLAVGSSGSQVLQLQQTLEKYGYLKTAPTGYFGIQTKAALVWLQQTNGLAAVGYTGPQTRKLLNSVTSSGGSSASSATVTTTSTASKPATTGTASELTTLTTLEGNLSTLEAENAAQQSTSGTATSVVGSGSASTVISRTLAEGSRGSDVLELQQILNKLGYLQASPTGFFGALTANAVARFQESNGLSAVGYTGPKTRQALNNILYSSLQAETNAGAATESTGVSTSGTVTPIDTSTVDDSSPSDSSGSSSVTTTPAPVSSSNSGVVSSGGGGGGEDDSGSVDENTSTGAATDDSDTSGSTTSTTPSTPVAPIGSIGPVLPVAPNASSTPITQTTSTSTPEKPAPTLTFTSNVSSITSGSSETSATLKWTSTNTDTCVASGSWTGSQPIDATLQIPSITSSKSYVLTCTGLGGSVTKTVAITYVVSSPVGTTSPKPAPVLNPTPVLNPAPTTTPTPTPTPTPAPSLPNVSYQVAAGCYAPTSNSGKTFYVDAVNGSDTTGDGSAAKPWQTLTYVLTKQVSDSQYARPFVKGAATKAVNPTGAVHAGDTILLMTGNYGDVQVVGLNSNFITIEPAPGQSPLLSSIDVVGASRWIIHGLKVQSLQSGYLPGITVSNAYAGIVDNIIVDDNNVSSTDDTSSWSVADWLAKGRSVGIDMDTGAATSAGGGDSNCLSITNNDVHDIQTGIAVGISNSLISHNTIDNFAHDALDYDANNLVISHNYITNAIHIDDNHPDGMQGQIGRLNSADSTAGYSNVTIDSNLIIRQSNPNLSLANGLQGIDNFDMNISNLTVTNNVVVTNSYQGLSFSSIHGGLIANNTLMYDGGLTSNYSAPVTWLLVGSVTHEGTPSNNVLVENNIAPDVIQGTSAATFLNNIAQYQLDLTSATGTVSYLKKAGVYAGNNIIDPTVANGFVKYDMTNMLYDLHLLPSSPANGIGTANGAPSIDYDGHSRSGTIAAGAYASSYPTPVVAATTTAPVAKTTTTIATSTVTTTSTSTTATSTTSTTSKTSATSTKVALSQNRSEMLASVFTAYSELLSTLRAAIGI